MTRGARRGALVLGAAVATAAALAVGVALQGRGGPALAIAAIGSFQGFLWPGISR